MNEAYSGLKMYTLSARLYPTLFIWKRVGLALLLIWGADELTFDRMIWVLEIQAAYLIYFISVQPFKSAFVLSLELILELSVFTLYGTALFRQFTDDIYSVHISEDMFTGFLGTILVICGSALAVYSIMNLIKAY